MWNVLGEMEMTGLGELDALVLVLTAIIPGRK